MTSRVESMDKNFSLIDINISKDGKVLDLIIDWDKRGYNIIEKISLSKHLGNTVDIEDVALIKNMSKKSRVNMYC
jgi:hypothetical protein